MNSRDSGRILVLGYGNPGRQDDGLGPAIVEAIERLGLPGVEVESDYQLNIEDGALAARFDLVIFVDASRTAGDPFEIRTIGPSRDITFTSHAVGPESILAVCEEHFGRVPEAWLVGVRGHEWEFREGLSEKARRNQAQAVQHLKAAIERWKEKPMATAGSRKTILIIDDDPDIRASLRIVLESAGYSVGEASTGEEGLKVAERVEPDAIIVDLMMEAVDSGSKVASQLKENRYGGPVFMLSAAGDAVNYNVDARELGLQGVFQKPVNHKVLLQALKAKLGA